MRVWIMTAAALATGATASGAEFVWGGAMGGALTSAALWDGGVAPGMDDGALFASPGGYTVTLSEDADLGYLAVDGSSPVFQFGSSRLDLGFVGSSPAAVSVGRTGGGVTSSMLLVSGTIAGDTVYVGEAAGSIATATIAGGTSRLAAGFRADVGRLGQGVLEIIGGAEADLAQAFIGSSAGSQGRVTVTGAGSRLESDFVTVGLGGQGTLQIQNGGLVDSDGVRVGASGALTLSGTGSMLDCTGADVTVGHTGSSTMSFGSGTLRARDLVFGASSGDAEASATSGLFLLSRDLIVGGTGFAEATFSSAHSTLCQRARLATGNSSIGELTVFGNLTATVGVDVSPGLFSLGRLDIGDTGVVTSPLTRVFTNGTVTGSGQIVGTLETSGTVSPSGTLVVTGDYTMQGALGPGSLVMAAGGTPRTLDVSGTATLAGLFRVTVAEGFTPTTDQAFVALRAGSITGAFSTVQTPNADWSVEVVGNEVIATFTGVSSDPEDLDGNGSVGAGDLAILLAAWGPCGACAADLDGSGAVGASDLAILLAAWG